MTLLHRPHPPAGALVRQHLLDALDAGLSRDVTLITAPAGYGKTVLASQWCGRLPHPAVWISLDRDCAGVPDILRYIRAGTEAAMPGTMPATGRLLDLGGEIAVAAAITTLSNDFESLPVRAVLVFDDYHQVTDTAVHDLMAGLLRHPPECVHLAILSRRDPPWSTGSLRAAGRLHELRVDDLRFTIDEAAELVAGEVGRDLTDGERAALDASTEGWAAGLRLAIQARRHGAPSAAVFGVAHLDRGAQEYVVGEVLDELPTDVVRFMVAASYFDRFSADLCEAVTALNSEPPALSGRDFIDWLVHEQLFVVGLDDDGTWFRFHNVFGRLLMGWRSSRGARFALEEAEVHGAAAGVFLQHGMVDEAIRELAAAGETEQLTRVAMEHGAQLVDGDRWAELSVLLDAIPPELVMREPGLLILRAWLVGEHGGRLRLLAELLVRVERLLEQASPERPWTHDVRGQISVLRGTYIDLAAGDFAAAMAEAEDALAHLSDPAGRVVVQAYAIGAVGLASTGQSARADRLVNSAVGHERFADWPMDPMIWVRPMVGWVAGSLERVERGGRQLVATGQRLSHPGLLGYGHYFLGISAYESNRLAEAHSHLARSVDVDSAIVELLLHCNIALAFTAYATGRHNDAEQILETTVETVLDTHGDYNIPTAEAAMAFLDLRRGHRPAAHRWARAADDDVVAHRFMFFDRHPALVEVLLSSDADVARGRELLDRYLRSQHGSFNRPVNLKLLGLRAIDAARQGDTPGALATLRVAVARARDGGFVRSIADLGPELVPLLHLLDVDGADLEHVGSILAAIDCSPTASTDPTTSSMGTSQTGVGLTGRELDVLRLLAKRFSNKEISRELLIAPATVKKHTVTLYDKFHVHGRREAVEKATALGYLND